MLSVFSHSPRLVPTIPAERAGTPVPVTYDGKTKDVTMYERLEDALEPLVSTILASGVQPDQSITLRCNLPTTPSLDLDLNDLRKLHSRSLKFIHALIGELRSKNVRASYRLTVSNSTSYALLRVTSDESISPQTELDDLCVQLQTFISSTIERDHTYLTHLTEVPALIIS